MVTTVELIAFSRRSFREIEIVIFTILVISFLYLYGFLTNVFTVFSHTLKVNLYNETIVFPILGQFHCILTVILNFRIIIWCMYGEGCATGAFIATFYLDVILPIFGDCERIENRQVGEIIARVVLHLTTDYTLTGVFCFSYLIYTDNDTCCITGNHICLSMELVSTFLQLYWVIDVVVVISFPIVTVWQITTIINDTLPSVRIAVTCRQITIDSLHVPLPLHSSRHIRV